MTIFHFSSTDASAPVLNNATGCLKTLLKACLIGTNGIAYGSKASVGWTLVGESTYNIAVKSSDSTSTGMIFQLMDDGVLSGTVCEASLSMWETWTGFGSGTNQSPTSSELAAGCILRHANSSSNSTAIYGWDIICDSKTVYLFLNWFDGTGVYCDSGGFGDFDSFVGAADAWAAFVYGRKANNNSSQIGSILGPQVYYFYSTTAMGTFASYTNPPAARIARSYDGSATSVPFGIDSLALGSAATSSATGLRNPFPHAYPNPANGGITFSPVLVLERMPTSSSNEGMRGVFRGLYVAQIANIPNTTGAFTPAPPSNLPGRNFWRSPTMNNNANVTGQANQAWMDLTGPW